MLQSVPTNEFQGSDRHSRTERWRLCIRYPTRCQAFSATAYIAGFPRFREPAEVYCGQNLKSHASRSPSTASDARHAFGALHAAIKWESFVNPACSAEGSAKGKDVQALADCSLTPRFFCVSLSSVLQARDRTIVLQLGRMVRRGSNNDE